MIKLNKTNIQRISFLFKKSRMSMMEFVKCDIAIYSVDKLRPTQIARIFQSIYNIL